MDKTSGITFLENSFLMSLLKDPDVTDISYNGESVFYLDNVHGRRKWDAKVEPQMVRDFVRQIANISEKQFSFQSPVLDVTIGKYRLNAVHPSIGRIGDDQALTFSIRIASEKPRITDESGFFPDAVKELFHVLVNSRASIVIGGLTGSGKTELQKYLISIMPSFSRVVIIDNVLELDCLRTNPDLDINSWQVNDNNAFCDIQNLVKNALRSNPDWLVVAESRGAEMIEVLNSSMTGHPILTTIHSLDIESMPSRMGRMVMMNDKKMDYEDVLKDIKYHFRYYVFLKREIRRDGTVRRFISAIGEMEENGEMNVIFKERKNLINFSKMSAKALNFLTYEPEMKDFIRCFTEDGK